RHYWQEVSRIPGITVWGPGFAGVERAPTVSITIDGLSPRDAATQLARKGIFLWDGDFYAIRAMEVLGLAQTGGVLRSGISLYNTQAEIDRLLEGLEGLARIGPGHAAAG
ncbi:MAG: aminotransferase class V-fold PLP-dependent enzyme, partial [Coprothermobacterota bacterium]|nr:aminotransferase class V-fold PLP-dependent enzyme [Coprothermobacterota bacterium]